MAASLPEVNVPSPEFIEALAILRALQLCLHRGVTNFISKSYCLLVVEEILHQESSCLAIGNILMDIKELMSLFSDCKVE